MDEGRFDREAEAMAGDDGPLDASRGEGAGEATPTARASAIVGASLTAAETIALLLEEAGAYAREASGPQADQARVAQLSHQVSDLADRINGAVKLSANDGPGLIGVIGLRLSALCGADLARLDIPDFDSVDLRAGIDGTTLDLRATGFSDKAGAAAVEGAIAGAASRVAAVIDHLADIEDKLATQSEFEGALSRSVETGLEDVAGPDIARESANLRALRLQQDLSDGTYSIANTAQRSILSLL